MIVITAPTSNIGSQVVARLLAQDQPLRLIARDPSKLSAEARERADVVEGSHGHADSVDRAFADADAVFWLPPPGSSDAATVWESYVDFTRPAAEAFARHGVGRVVGISALGRGTPPADRAGYVTASLAMDDLIAASGVPYRALVNPSFMDNMAEQAEPIRDQGMFFSTLPADRKLPTCATRDIAAKATELLLSDPWQGFDEVPVLGPEDLSPNDQAAIMTEVVGREVRFQQVSPEALQAQLVDGGMAEPMAEGMVEMFVAKADGLDEGVERTAETSSPTTFREWCEYALKPAVEGEAA